MAAAATAGSTTCFGFGLACHTGAPSASSDADHRHGVHVLATGRERPVRRRHLERVDLVRAQDRRQVGQERALRFRHALAAADAHPLGDVHYGLGPEQVDQLRVHRVHGRDRGLLEGQAAVTARLGVRDVPHRPVVQRDLDRGRRREHRARRDAVLQRRDQGERFERRAGLASRTASGRQVHPAVAGARIPIVGVLATDHRSDVAGPGIDHGHRARRIARIGEHRSHCALRGHAADGGRSWW